MLEIVFLGTGAAIPSRQRNLAAIWMRYSGEEGESFLFDCGEGTQRQMMAAKLSFMKIDHLFITHWHADHWAGLIGLIQTMNMEGRRSPLSVHGPEAGRFVDAILELGYWAPRFRVHPNDVPFEGREITELYGSGDFQILSTPARHSVPAVAYCFRERDKVNVDIEKAGAFGLRQGRLIGRLKAKGKVVHQGRTISLDDVSVTKPGLKAVYTGDTRPCPTIEALARDADLLIHDSTFDEQDDTIMHSGATDAAEAAKRTNAKHLVLTHFSRRYPDVSPLVEAAQKIFPDTLAAHDFMKINLKRDLFKVFR